MLIKVTNRCTMGCSHCMIEGSGPEGEHMSLETFDAALEFAEKLGSMFLLLSGGEPTEHPDIVELARKARGTSKVRFVLINSNGLFAFEEDKYRSIVELVNESQGFVRVQVINDKRYYPRNLELIGHKFELEHWLFATDVPTIFPCRRTRDNGIKPTRRAPNCWNLRANTRLNGLEATIAMLEGSVRLCTPSINVDGTIVAGEADTCFKIGMVTDRVEDIESRIKLMRCGTCGLRDNLEEHERIMVGERTRG